MAKVKKSLLVLDGLDEIHFSSSDLKLLLHETVISGHNRRPQLNTMALELLEMPFPIERVFRPWPARPRPPQKTTTRLLLPPGMRMRSLLSFFSERSCRRIIDPIIADMQHEWRAAHEAGNLSRARWVHILCTFHLLAALIANWLFSIWEAWKKTKLG